MKRLNKIDRDYIDFLRGFAILLMIWGHCIQFCACGQFDYFEFGLFKTIYAFHMPLFMLISGYLFYFSEQKRSSLSELVPYKVKSLLYPILLCSILYTVLSPESFQNIRDRKFPLLVGAATMEHFWFLWSVLAASVALAFAVKLSKKPLIQSVLCLLGFLVVAVFPNGMMHLYMYPYFVLGYVFARNETRLKPKKIVFDVIGLLSAAAFAGLMHFYQKKHFIYISYMFGGATHWDSLKIDGFRWGVGLFGSLAAIWITRRIFLAIKKENRVVNGIESIGRDSLAFYALSEIVLFMYLPEITNRFLHAHTWINWNDRLWLYGLVITPVMAVLFALLLSLLIRLLKRCRVYALVFGR